MDSLKKRGFVMVNRCILYRVEEEFVDHILLYCSYSREVQKMLWDSFGVEWVIPSTVKDLVSSYISPFRSRVV